LEGYIEAPSPKPVLALESLFPHGLDGFVMGVEEWVKRAGARFSRTINEVTVVLGWDADAATLSIGDRDEIPH